MVYRDLEVTEAHISDFLRAIPPTPQRNHGDEIQFLYCPYCGGGDSKDKWTSSINRRTGLFNCQRDSCKANKNIITLSQDFDFSLGHEIDEYFKPKKKYKTYKAPKEPVKPKPPAIEYLERRGITAKIVEKYEITTKKDSDNILVFPFYDAKRENLLLIKYRNTNFQKGKDKAKEWYEPNGKPILFGMNHCNLDNKTLIVTEGQIDSLSLAEAGIENAVSVPGGVNNFRWVPYCWNWISNFEKIIIFGDKEHGRITLVEDFKRRFTNKEIFHVREEDYKDCKDANEILQKYGKEQLKTCVENAESEPLDFAIDFADIKDTDIFSIEKVKTGIKQLDNLLYGGLPFPGVVVVTGKTSEGKSTFASQILVNAVNQGYECFAYSGELPADTFRAWTMFQMAGQQHVFTYQTRDGYEGYSISKTNRELINEWARGKLLVYDNTYIDSDNFSGIIEKVDKVIRKYGVRVILLDNLMTALDLDGERSKDRYERQSSFTKRLARLAMKYEVLIILVAHKRKNINGDNDIDEVMGSSDITNLATVTLSYGRDKKIIDPQRKLKLLKNRLFGKVDTDGWIMDFDEKSKRIYGAGDDVNVKYGWEKDTDDFVPTEETPFD